MDRCQAFEPPETWIPADRRWWGLDRRTVAPALVVFGLALVLAGVIPAAELDAMAGNRKDRKRHRNSAAIREQRRRARYTLAAAYDLAAVLTAARGADSDRVQFARAEIGRIRRGEPSQW